MRLGNFLFSSHLDEGEEILNICHRHPLVLKINSFKTFNFGVLLPLVILIFFPQSIIITGIWLIVGLFGMAYHLFDWYFDAWLLTNCGVIDIEQHGLFTRNSTRIDYHMIDGISYSIEGFLQTVFNYGNITVDKLGNKTSVNLVDAANPKKIERLLLKYQDRYVTNRSVRDHHALKDMLSEMIAYHVQNGKINFPHKD